MAILYTAQLGRGWGMYIRRGRSILRGAFYDWRQRAKTGQRHLSRAIDSPGNPGAFRFLVRRAEGGNLSNQAEPYVRRWRISYCRRRADRASGHFDLRPRIFSDASFINKNVSSWHTWWQITDRGGDLVDDLNVGGAGDRWAVMRALADWRDSDPRKRSLRRTRPTYLGNWRYRARIP